MSRLKPMLTELKKRRSRINKTIRAMEGLLRSENAEVLLPPKKPMARARIARKKTSAAA